MSAVAHFLSTNVVQLSLLRSDAPLSVATGFFLKWKSRWYLISNWHVLSGRSALTGRPQRRDGAVPDRCSFRTFELRDGNIGHTPYSLPLTDANGSSRWFEHPIRGPAYDIGVLPFGESQPGTAKDLLDPEGHDDSMWIDLGGELFLPGYPLGLSAPTSGMAIWKRGSLATSAEIGLGMNEFVYVDTATREGMSGAPCLALANRSYPSLDLETGQMSWKERPISYRLIGVYSGRVNAGDDFGAQLGVVWRENLIYETIEGAKPATVEPR